MQSLRRTAVKISVMLETLLVLAQFVTLIELSDTVVWSPQINIVDHGTSKEMGYNMNSNKRIPVSVTAPCSMQIALQPFTGYTRSDEIFGILLICC